MDCFSDGCLVLGILDAYQLRKEICPHCPQNIFFARRLFFQVSCCLPHEGILTVSFPKRGDDYKRHLENFSVSGLTLPPSNVRICERFLLQVNIFRKFHRPGFTNRPLKVGISEGTFKKVFDPGLTLPPPHFRISERIFKNLSPAP